MDNAVQIGVDAEAALPMPSAGALFGLGLPELTAVMAALGQKPYRARQVFDALYKQRVASLDEVTTLPVALRDELRAAGWEVGLPEMVQTAKSGDGSEAAVEESGDRVDAAEAVTGQLSKIDKRNWGALAEQGFRRATICISSQVGCAVNCQFCLTAKLGIRRNLTAGEIAGQVAAVLNRHGVKMGKDRINLVFIGMGEPFLNYDSFMQSVRVLVDGIGVPESRMTVSTSGILPGIEAFAKETMRPKLALSLNASNDVVRERIMPITRKWNIAKLL